MATRQLKALTISQPWADLIRRSEKIVENRYWLTNYRGPLAIHAGKGMQYLSKPELAKYTTGAVVAITELVACLNLSDLQKAPEDMEIEGTRYTVGQILTHKYTEGPCLWIFDSTYAIKPIVVPGKQGLWIWSCESELIVREEEIAAR